MSMYMKREWEETKDMRANRNRRIPGQTHDQKVAEHIRLLIQSSLVRTKLRRHASFTHTELWSIAALGYQSETHKNVWGCEKG